MGGLNNPRYTNWNQPDKTGQNHRWATWHPLHLHGHHCSNWRWMSPRCHCFSSLTRFENFTHLENESTTFLYKYDLTILS